MSSYYPIILTLTTYPTLFPYTTLFRSLFRFRSCCLSKSFFHQVLRHSQALIMFINSAFLSGVRSLRVPRSEEHTSELQSHSDLVCRLLLENKKYLCWYRLINLISIYCD